MKIAISGCGIAGTAAAKLLSNDDHDVTLFEQAPECRPIGAGVLLQPSGQAVLQRLGIMDLVAGESEPLDGLWARQVDGSTLARLKYEWLAPELVGFGVHRGRLLHQLLRLCQTAGVQIENRFRVVRSTYCPQRKTSVVSDTGKSVSDFDFLIAADGSRSVLRGESGLTKQEFEYDYAALWNTGPCEYQPGTLVQVVRGTTDLIGLLPIGGGESSFFYGLPKDGYDALVSRPLDEWKARVLAICPQAASMMGRINTFDEFTFGTYRHVTMQRWHTDHVVFIGDAAHATSPHLGQGVNLALEDAASFSNHLRSQRDFPAACQGYSQKRKWKLRYYQQFTRFLSPFFQASGSTRGILRDAFLPWMSCVPGVRREMIRTLSGFKRGWIG